MADSSETTQVSEPPRELGETGELLGAVRSLAEQVGSLRAEVQALRASSALLPGESMSGHGWEDRAPVRHDSPHWVRALDSPAARRPAVPQLLLEIVFLVAVAVLAALAELEPPLLVALMAGAWALVAAAEWAVAREAGRREEALASAPFGSGIVADDPTWFTPPAERDVLEDHGAESTAARLPPPSDE